MSPPVGSRFTRCAARREGKDMSGRFRRLLLLALAALVGTPLALGSAVRPAAASGAGTMTIYPAMSGPWAMTVGPDAAFWFTDIGDNMIGRMSVSGKLTLFAATASTCRTQSCPAPMALSGLRIRASVAAVRL